MATGITQDMLYQGKVRDVYNLPGSVLGPGQKNALLFVASDRISAFDVVLPTLIPDKGKVLNQNSAFWFDKTQHILPNHMLQVVEPGWLSSIENQTTVSELAPFAHRGMVVKRAERIDIECIVRGYLAGSAWSEYKASGTVWGQSFPEGMKEGQLLERPLFTPTTKAEEGHDESMTNQQVVDMVGQDLAQRNAHENASERGSIQADTKMQFGLLDGQLILIDELFTPDSSRFWDASAYEPGKSQPNYDKQYVRDWLIDQGWDREPPAPELPDDVVRLTQERYLEAYQRLTGRDLSDN
ncbi:MAG: phosphoribosylaminoimidazolesuccinocarboxamide synthase [Dehalococcoidia bacterium]|nr:phosphoribosylaminoimidazolesuccinocarboxamide synthase [Dehalococcoidia bacterium]